MKPPLSLWPLSKARTCKMVEIIRPEFKRAISQKLRMLKSRPELSRLPEFKKKTSDGTGAILILIATALLLRKR